jgi:preprotein translocase subunit SecA
MHTHNFTSQNVDATSVSNINLQAHLQIFMPYAQQGADSALLRKQDLLEWFEKTLKKLESCRTLKDFFGRLNDDIRENIINASMLLKHLKEVEDKLNNLADSTDDSYLLEQLKQGISEAIQHEIFRIISDNQAKNARTFRRKNEEKVEIEEECEVLKKKVGVSTTNSNHDAEIATLAWRYLMHNLPKLLNDVNVVNKQIPLWDKQARGIVPSESEWTNNFLLLLKDRSSIYSSLPEHIKKGLLLCFTSHKHIINYADYHKFEASLIGRPTVTRLENDGRSILRIHGGHLSLNGVLTLPELADLKSIDEIQILATGTLFLDKDMNDLRFRGKNIVITGKTMDVTTAVTFNTSGMDAKQHDSKNARDGKSFSYSSSGSGLNGEKGRLGYPGESAGHVYIQAGDEIKQAERLRIIANGGKGGDGQYGGRGDKGQDGQDGRDANCPNDGGCNPYQDKWGHHASQRALINHGTSGTTGQSGGDGGVAGKGGQGGHAGQVVVRDGRKDYSKIANISAIQGQDGTSGEPGQGGEAGLDGRQGLSAIRVLQGFGTTAPDEYKEGYDVYAYKEKRVWYLKDLLHAAARVPASQVKNSERTRTHTNGQVGARAYNKNAASQKASIHLSTILQQCPDVAESLSVSESAKAKGTHEQLNQKLDRLFVLGDRQQVLQGDIQQLEKQQALLVEKLNKLEETAQSIINETVRQRVAERHSVTQLADAESRRAEPDEYIPFFFTASKHQGKTVPPAFQRVMKIALQNINESEQARIGEHTWTVINKRIEQDIKKIKMVCPDLDITENNVYDSLETIVKIVSKNRPVSPEDLIKGDLYEMSIWHVCDPELAAHALHEKKDFFECLLAQLSCVQFLALSFMQLNADQLDKLRLNDQPDRTLIYKLDDYYHENFYQPRKKEVLSRKSQLTLDTQQYVNVFIENILFETEKASSGIGYAKSIDVMETLLREMSQLGNEPRMLQAKLFELLASCQSDNECNSDNRENKPDSQHATKGSFVGLSEMPFPSTIYAPRSAAYKKAKKTLADFIARHETDTVWQSIFERVKEQISHADVLPFLEEINQLFSMMALRETVATLPLDLQAEDIASWGDAVLLGNTREKLKRFVMSKTTENATDVFEKLDQQVTLLSSQPTILYLFYQKLFEEASLFDPKLTVSVSELEDILSALGNLEQKRHDRAFLSALQKTPFPGWGRVVRERALSLSLFGTKSPTWKNKKDQKRCLFSLCKLEESLGKQKIDNLVSCIRKAGNTVNYATLANLLMQLRYQQLTLDDNSLLLLEQAGFENWSVVLLDYHKKETQKPRDLEALLHIMQNDVANKKIDILFPKDANPPVIINQIKDIRAHLAITSHALTNSLFRSEEEQKSTHFSRKAISTWTAKDILVWSNAFRKQTNGRQLVKEHHTEIIAIISQAIFLEKEFYPLDAQYLALLTAFDGSDHAQKMVSQIATGQGKTITGAILALLKVFAGDRVDFITSSSVLAEETEAEIGSIARMFGVTSACNTEFNDGPYSLELIEGGPSEAQKEMLCKKRGVAIIKKGNTYLLGLVHSGNGDFFEQPLDLSKWPDFKKKITEHPFRARQCCVADELHEYVFRMIKECGLEHHVPEPQDETQKLQESYRSDILCGDLQSFMRAHLLTEFYGKNITQNRKAFAIMDEVDRLLDEMQDILYLSHDIPDMHHLTSLLAAIWQGVNQPACAEETEENIAGLTAFFLTRLSPGNCSIREQMEGKILIPLHLEDFVKRRLSTWIRSAYIAKNGLSRDGEYIVAKVGEDGKGVYLVDRDTGVTSRNKELANGVHQFLRFKHQDWPKPLSLKAIYCDPVSFLLEYYINGFFGMTGTVGSEQDYQYFKKLFGINNKCIVPRHELLNLHVDPPIIVSSFHKQMKKVAKIVRDATLSSRQPFEIICDTIADAKALTEYLKCEVPKASIHTRIHSFEPFSKGSKEDAIKLGEGIVTTSLSGRGTDFHLDPEAERIGLCLIKLSVAEHERADKQVDGRTARKRLPGRLIQILRPNESESSIEEMHAKRDLRQEQFLDRVRKEDLHQNRINRQLFEAFSELARDIEKTIRKTELGSGHDADGYVERQMAALRTHWAMWLDEVEQKMDEGFKDTEALNAQFQVFRKKMLERAEEKGSIKLVTGALEITRLGIWFGIENSFFDQSLECFNRVIDDYYPFSGQAIYYKALVMLNAAKPDDFKVRKEAALYLKRARVLLKQELERLYEPVDRMVAIDNILREKGQGLNDSQFKKTVESMAQSLMVHIGAIDLFIGSATDPDFFLSDTDNKEEAETRFNDLVKDIQIKGYRISKRVSVTDDKQLEILLINGKKQVVQFPSEVSEYKDKIIDMIFIRKEGNQQFRTISYFEYCKLVFGEEEALANDSKKMIMKLSWDFLQRENVISQPTVIKTRLNKASLDKKSHSNLFSEASWIRSLGLLRILDEIKVHTDGLENMSERGRISTEVLSFFNHYLEFDRVIRVDKKPVRWNWAATLVLLWAVAQVTVGILIGCPVLVQQGIGDMVFLATSAISGNFSMENYLRHKRTAVATVALSIAGKRLLDAIIKSAEKYQMAKEATRIANLAAQHAEGSLPQAFVSNAATPKAMTFFSFAKKVVDDLPVPVLKQHTDLSFFSQFGNATGEAFKQTATHVTMQYLLTTFCSSDVDKNVRETLGKKLQLNLDTVATEIKCIAMEILAYSESPEQAERIIQYLFENTLKEHLPERQNALNMALSMFSTPEMGKIFGDEVTALSGKEVLGNMVGSIVANLDKIGATSRAATIAKKVMDEVKENLSEKLKKLKLTRQSSVRTSSEVAKFSKFMEEEIEHLKCNVGNESLRGIGDTYLTPIVRWTWDTITERTAQFISKNNSKNEGDYASNELFHFVNETLEDRMHSSSEEKEDNENDFDPSLHRIKSLLNLEEIKNVLERKLDYKELSNAHQEAREIGHKLIKKMKGKVQENFENNPNDFYHYCSIYMSYALEKVGFKIPYEKDKTLSWVNEKGEKCWAYFRVKDFETFFRKTFGEPIVITKDNIADYTDIKGIRGLCLVKFPPPVISQSSHSATGHAIFFRGDSYVECAHLKEDTLLVWLLPTKKLQSVYEKLKTDEHFENEEQPRFRHF